MAAEGIRKRHTAKCRAGQSKRCRCAGSWEAWIYLRRESRKVYKTFPTEAEAKDWRADNTKAAKTGAARAPSKLTLEQAAWCWLQGADRGAVRYSSGSAYKPSTLRGYRASLRLRVLPEFGAHRLSDLRRVDVQEFVDRLLGAGLAAGTVRNTAGALQAICRHAISRELLAVNPTARLNLPTSRGRRERIASAAEAARLLEALPAAERALWATAMYAGLRRGELRALRWCDIDLGASLIAVERSWDQVAGAIEPKSDAGTRKVPMLAVLRDHLDQLKIDSGRDGEDLAFGRTPTEAFAASTIRDRALAAWDAFNAAAAKRAEKEGGEPDILLPIKLHECRHTFASLLIDAGVNAKAISTFMGHANISITFDRYGHLMPGSRDQARELVDRYLDAAVAEARVEAAAADSAPHAPQMPQSAAPPVRSPAEAPTETDERKPHE